MYWWNLDKLSAELIAERLTETDRFAYYLGGTAWMVLAWSIPSGPYDTWWSVADAIVSGLVTLVGVWYWFLANGGSRGRGFLERVTALTWVVGNRLLICALPCYALLSLATLDAIVNQPWYEQVYPTLIAITTWWSTFWTILIVIWVRLCLRDIHHRSSSPTPET